MEVSTVIGVDTHKDNHTAALVDGMGVVLGSRQISASPAGYRELVRWAAARGQQRVWVVEGTGSYGAGLTTYLQQSGETVFEGEYPRRPARGAAGKSDLVDAILVARDLLSRPHPGAPRRRAEREVLRVLMCARSGAVEAAKDGLNQLYAFAVSAPEPLSGRLSKLRRKALVDACLRLPVSGSEEVAVTAVTMRSVARRVQALWAEAADYERQISTVVRRLAPELLVVRGVGPLSAAQLLVSWSHPGRIRNEAAFAKLAGVAPLPASSGRVQRHRLNRYGDRQLNRALHLVAITRARCDAETREYIARRIAGGKTEREARRCIKRYLARRLFRLLEGLDRT